MSKKWFYVHDGQTLGPMSAAEMKTLAAEGKIRPEGKIWSDGSDPKTAVSAATAINFKSLPADRPSPPVGKLEPARPAGKKKRPRRPPRVGPPLQPEPRVPLPEPPPPAAELVSANTTLSLQDLVRKARFGIEQWVDEEDSVDLVLAGDLETIKQDPALQEIMRSMQGWGPDVMDRLWKHLEFTVENRRKYYQALLARRQQ